MKKYIALIVAVIILGGGSFLTQRLFIESLAPAPEASAQTFTDQQPAPPAKSSATPEVKPQEIEIALSVEDKRYTVPIQKGSTVLDVMSALRSTAQFSFSGREFPSLGFFVEEINGKKNTDGYYWILYVNGKPSNTGVSQTFLSENDSVEWKYEKGY